MAEPNGSCCPGLPRRGALGYSDVAMRKLVLVLGGSLAVLAGLVLEGCKEECAIGSEGCDCTSGDGCDPGLTCYSGVCVNAGPMEAGDEVDEDEEDTNDNGSSSSDSDDSSSDSTDEGPKLDTLQEDTNTSADDGPCMDTGCKKVDMLFALDGSGSMIEEINALKSGQAFLGIVNAIEGLNCGGIDYRIGVTGDNDNGWITPNGWGDPNPWFDSATYTAQEISVHFQAAATKVGQSGGASTGCEHVLSSAVDLLGNDSSGFIREDALLVLVLMTDVDDYGAYDQIGGNSCGLGCAVGGQPVSVLQDTLVALKGGDPAGVAAIVIAGDPSINAGVNFCGQPGSCCGGIDCQAFWGTRLYEFAGLQTGMNGYTANICEGPQAVPAAVQTALGENIDLACQEFEPVG